MEYEREKERYREEGRRVGFETTIRQCLEHSKTVHWMRHSGRKQVERQVNLVFLPVAFVSLFAMVVSATAIRKPKRKHCPILEVKISF